MKSVLGVPLSLLLLLLPLASGLECSKHDILNKYRVSEVAAHGTVAQDTPPSETKENWWLSICDENRSKAKDSKPEQCKDDDTLCGVTSVSLPGKEPLVTRIMDFSGSLASEVKETAEALSIKLSGASWGSHNLNAEIYLECEESGDGSLKESSWNDDKTVKLVFSGPFGCLKKGDNGNGGDGNSGDEPEKPPADEKPKGGAGLGSWLVWLFMYAIIFAFVYLVVTSYMSTRNGSFHDFREEFIDRSKTFATNLPQFAKEVAGKIVNTGSSSQRGGYSAV
ncbi:autophagy-related protein 27 [Kluyveromyces marxianus]|uniref:Autophagy-related protein 27 n=2 Tax=Kluyveromyces marxianus TaxID=4911 RepID=W0T330_KLUMD|nr:autophagy-related protein 27 [Kluyveromyces marxianus DMKU3-1042]QGN13846.1 autophagy-related protein 27 [Kluyveromyces marxianus]BAO37997.1 autophagy-related protein 27 [Kluyveromyces marxianus DMKU3-1042]